MTAEPSVPQVGGPGARATPAPGAERRFLIQATKELLAGCRVNASDGTVLYTPDGRGNYRALWTRDFTYMVENAGDLLPSEHVEAALRYLISRVRADGAAPDRVRADGVPVYTAGGEGHPLGEPNLDNGPFLVIAVDCHLNRLSGKRRLELFRKWEPNLRRAMDFVPRHASGLVYNDPLKPHSPYGFTDTVAKTGELCFESLLYWTACRRLGRWEELADRRGAAAEFRARARQIETGLQRLWDDEAGALLAASKDCRQLDIWANAYALWLDFPLGEKRRERVVDFLFRNRARFLWHGQVRHLLAGEHWQRLLAPVPPGRYQNGAYWATASGWMMAALARRDPTVARALWRDLIADFRQHGVCECVSEGYRKLPTYVVSATNPLAAVRRLGF